MHRNDRPIKHYTSVAFGLNGAQIYRAVDTIFAFLKEPRPLREYLNFSIALSLIEVMWAIPYKGEQKKSSIEPI